ncbi:PfkB family carbohydrate kinase, partial [Paraburkholderia sp. SARCC-3016]|uniref:PfkB family carbohydrate kinase n=1 Tax=Paraburkholderia sp. SARCC-3016 TaxID=3058611 RepID=UPI0028072127
MVKATHKQPPEIVAFGEAMVEFSQRSAGGTDYLQGYGGDTSNFCIAAARQGANTGFISAVGGDRFGRLLLELWQQENVDTSAVRIDESAHTGVYFVSHGPGGHHFEYLSRRPSGLRKTKHSTNSLAHRTTWLR